MSLKSFRLLKRFLHDPGCDRSKVTIWYIDRGAPDDLSSVDGFSLKESESPFFFEAIPTFGDTKAVPYHRITRIEYDGKCLFERMAISAADQNMIFGVDFLTERKHERQRRGT